MAQIERGEARIQRRISIKKALDSKVDGCQQLAVNFWFKMSNYFYLIKPFVTHFNC